MGGSETGPARRAPPSREARATAGACSSPVRTGRASWPRCRASCSNAEANIVSSHQYSSDPSGGRFFLRTEFFLPDGDRAELEEGFAAEVAAAFGMQWKIRWWGERRRVAILVSRYDHCLLDLLWRSRRGELDAQIEMVISNHRDLEAETLRPAWPTTTFP